MAIPDEVVGVLTWDDAGEAVCALANASGSGPFDRDCERRALSALAVANWKPFEGVSVILGVARRDSARRSQSRSNGPEPARVRQSQQTGFRPAFVPCQHTTTSSGIAISTPNFCACV